MVDGADFRHLHLPPIETQKNAVALAALGLDPNRRKCGFATF